MSDRQHVERVRGARRARLTPAPGTQAEPHEAVEEESEQGPNDERMRRDVPPHY